MLKQIDQPEGDGNYVMFISYLFTRLGYLFEKGSEKQHWVIN
jgi:hypothetical protein